MVMMRVLKNDVGTEMDVNPGDLLRLTGSIPGCCDCLVIGTKTHTWGAVGVNVIVYRLTGEYATSYGFSIPHEDYLFLKYYNVERVEVKP